MIGRKQKIKSQGQDLDEDSSYESIQNDQTELQLLLGEDLFNVPAKREKKELNLNLNEQKKRKGLKFEIDYDYAEENISYQDSRFEDDEDNEGYETINVTGNEDGIIKQLHEGQFYFDLEDVQKYRLYGQFQFLLEKRITYISKNRLSNAIHVLFPFIQISDTQRYTKTENLIEPNCRTDSYNFCYDADRIFHVMQMDGFEFYYLKHVQQDKLIKWKKHIYRAAHQSQAEQQDIINLKPEECVI
ncbi:MAG: hypothetical protein EZS28_020392 [Streblomastix strix]|uniref:PH domain-containing protein n=1 Tax=Streblomastix strix TaxID=222440 RepID=A0A5J4VNC9_9EUKA|nr:MAG: hypothetical protein EZS28_020392 [Streblomastix strix]